MAAIIQLRRDTAAAWTSANPVLASGEFGYETDTSFNKVGDGLSDWVTLPYNKANDGVVETIVAGTAIEVDSSDPANPVVSSPLASTALQPGEEGVTQIVAGTNITLDPVGGTGAVTVNAAGGAVGGQVDSVVGGTDITVDASDPINPIVNYTGTPGGQVDSVVAGTGVSVNATDPANPIVSSPLANTALQSGDNISELVNDSGYLTATTGVEPGDNVSTLTNDSGYLTTTTGDARYYTETESDTLFATAAQGGLADSATQPGDGLSTLTNDENFKPLTGQGVTAMEVVTALPGVPDPTTLYFVAAP